MCGRARDDEPHVCVPGRDVRDMELARRAATIITVCGEYHLVNPLTGEQAAATPVAQNSSKRPDYTATGQRSSKPLATLRGLNDLRFATRARSD